MNKRLVLAASTWALVSLANPVLITLSPTDLTGQDLQSDGTWAWVRATEGNNELLFRTDGTSAGTTRVRSFAPIGGFRAAVGLVGLTPGGAYVQVGSGPLEWTDGTAAAFTTLGSPGARLSPAGRASSGRTFFVVPGANFTLPMQLYTSDQTPAGTSLVSGASVHSTAYSRTAIVDARLYFVRPNGDVDVTDGITTTTFLARDPNRVATSVYACGPLLFVVSQRNGQVSMMAGAPPLAPSLVVAPGPLNVTAAACSGDLLFFAGSSAAFGEELWRSDGTAAGTFLVEDLNAGPASGFATRALVSHPDGGVHLAATDGSGLGVWYADGSDGGLAQVSTSATTPDLLSASVGPWAFFRTGAEAFMVSGSQVVGLNRAFAVTQTSGWKSSPQPVAVGTKLLSFGAATTAQTRRDQLWVFDTALPLATDDGGVGDAGPLDAGPFDAGASDAGRPDGGVADAGVADAGPADSGVADSGLTDAGVADGGLADAGPTDAGAVTDAGGLVADAGGGSQQPTGCGCRTDASLLPLVSALVVLVRRRRRGPVGRASAGRGGG